MSRGKVCYTCFDYRSLSLAWITEETAEGTEKAIDWKGKEKPKKIAVSENDFDR